MVDDDTPTNIIHVATPPAAVSVKFIYPAANPSLF